MTAFAEVHYHNPFLHLLDYADTLEPFSSERYSLVKNVFAWTYATEVIEGKCPVDMHPIAHQQTVEQALQHRAEIESRLGIYETN